MTRRSLILTYLALVALAAISWIAAAAGTGIAVAVGIAVIKTLLIALVFMELAGPHPADRVIAVVAVFFVLLMCGGAIADVAFR